MMYDLSKFKVEKAPKTVYYIPNFITEQEEQQLLDKIYKVPKPKWTQLSNRRLQNWGGIPHPKGMLVEYIPEWLSLYLDKVCKLGVFKDSCKPNHVLINEYLAGQGIMSHLDGPLFYPTITTLSLGSHTVLDFYSPRPDTYGDSSDKETMKLLSLLIESRSLLILQEDMYNKYLHGIQEKTQDVISDSEISNWNVCKILKSAFEKDVCFQKDFCFKSARVPDRNVDSEESEQKGLQTEMVSNDVAKVHEVHDLCGDNLCESDLRENSKCNDKDPKISCCKLQRGTRISLTMRHVPKTSKVKLKLCR